MKVAIVGTSTLTEHERKMAIDIIVHELLREPGVGIITGDANGVDEAVRNTRSPDASLTVVKALDKHWEGKHGYKSRNTKIVEECDELICITTRTRTQKCYHCNLDHQRTGGCWTANLAGSLGKHTRTYIVN